jgi:hypothetical protein
MRRYFWSVTLDSHGYRVHDDDDDDPILLNGDGMSTPFAKCWCAERSPA